MARNQHMSRRSRKSVGVVGLGIIGSRVTENLRRKGFQVFVWNRTPRPVPNFVGSPAEIAEMCDYIQIFVSDDDALLQVTQNLGPALAPRHLIMAHSTVAPHTMRAAGDIAERRGARFVEAPFTGSKVAAEKGELVYYAGGDEAAIKDARPILEASSQEIIEIGAIGQATAIKIATNMITAATVQSAAEALALVQSTGLSLEKFISAMEGNASNSKTLAMKLPRIIKGDFEPHFSLKHMLKDMQIASRYGLSQHLELGVTAAARDRLLEQMQRGFGDEDYSAVARKYFGKKKTVTGEEGLELFEKPRSAEPYPFTSHEPKQAQPDKSDEPSSVQPEPPEPVSVEQPATLQPAAEELLAAADESFVPEEVTRISPSIGSLASNLEDNAGEAAQEIASSASQNPATEEEGKRGLFSRLLRRTDY
jgi:3-hydroxyisobutyrate dehydrogenase-like beta-hydroxyacid dehydrogenase